MKKSLILAVCLALLAGAVAGPATAAKKKKPKQKPPVVVPVATPVTFWFHNDPAACAAENYTLQLTEATEGSNCGSAFSGPVNEILVQAGEEPAKLTYNATEGVALTLDATQKISGVVHVASHSGNAANPAGLGVGPTTLVVEVLGDIAGEPTSLGVAEVDYVVTPASKIYETKFEISPPAELDKAVMDTLSISLYNRGFAPLHGFYRVWGPASNFTVSTWT